jgi:peptide/nickel transport system ATP-binding protein
MDDAADKPLLRVRDLTIHYGDATTVPPSVRAVSFDLGREALALVGSSGSGKSSVARALLALLRPPASVRASEMSLLGRDLLNLSPHEWDKLRGNEIAMVLQDPKFALNPVLTVGEQVGEALGPEVRKSERRERVAAALEAVGLSGSGRLLSAYPHHLSGGMGQRVMLAASVIARPRVLVADEPTSALDADLRDQALDLVADLTRRLGMGLLLITHDLAQAVARCDRVLVMDQGAIVDRRPASELSTSSHPYTRALWASHPSAGTYGTRLVADPTLSFRQTHAPDAPPDTTVEALRLSELSVTYAHHRRPIQAVSSVSLAVRQGEIFGLFGPSGCGKTTLLRVMAGILPGWTGHFDLFGQPVASGTRWSPPLRRTVQMVFQDPYASLHPRHRVGAILQEVLHVAGEDNVEDRAAEALREVGLDPGLWRRFPHQLSGGQRQRVVIARALLLNPRLLLADEPTSALDLTTQAGILDLLAEIRLRHGMTLVLVSHDPGVLAHLCDRVLGMELGRFVGEADHNQIVQAGSIPTALSRPNPKER